MTTKKKAKKEKVKKKKATKKKAKPSKSKAAHAHRPEQARELIRSLTSDGESQWSEEKGRPPWTAREWDAQQQSSTTDPPQLMTQTPTPSTDPPQLMTQTPTPSADPPQLMTQTPTPSTANALKIRNPSRSDIWFSLIVLALAGGVLKMCATG